jgi:hypothetical protein
MENRAGDDRVPDWIAAIDELPKPDKKIGEF